MNREFIISVCEGRRETEKGPEAEERGHGKGGTKEEGESHFLSLDIYDTAAADF